ncbi:MAG: hypothetical protein HZC36_12715 [Armatimonadetes bacterium]|nr:hypothetical protein [Armatimonadota bacterium]
MTQRERFLTLIQGKSPDRMPYWFGGPRTSTFAAWRRQGLSEDQQNAWSRWLGEEGFTGIGKLSFEPWPRFEEVILEEHGNERTWIDHYGVKRVDAIHQPTAGFATRRYLEFPVKDRASFEAYAERYNPASPERTTPMPGENERDTANPDGYRVFHSTVAWKDRVATCNQGEVPVSLTIPGLWWTLRDWCGFEGLCMMCAEEPALVRDMMDFWTDFILRMVDEPLKAIRVDHIMMNEDMAYKTAAMLSPDMMRAYMLPNYERLMARFRELGVRSVMMDTDGHCGQVIDVFFPTGFDGTAPLEIAAYNDPGAYLSKTPKLTLFGGIDKRELMHDKRRVREEVVRRYRLARRYSNYVPMVDHGVPPDVPIRNFLYMAELLRGFADGEDLDRFEPSGRFEAELGPIEELFDPNAAYAAAYGSD